MPVEQPAWYNCLKELATPSDSATARRRLPAGEDEDVWRLAFGNPFESDSRKILESKALRRLADKAQVITRTATDDVSFDRTPHIRTRLVHTFDVVGFATTMASALGLNEPLVRAGALGHDLGHLPLGHDSETFFQRLGRTVRHEVFGVFLVEFIERRKHGGLNLTLPTLKIILRHSRGRAELKLGEEMSQEERLVLYADKLAYVSADPSDIFIKFRRTLRDGPLTRQLDERWQGVEQLLRSFTPDGSLPNQRKLQRCWGLALGGESAQKGCVSFEDSDVAHRFNQLRALMMDTYPLVNYCTVAGQGPLEWSYALLTRLGQERGVDPAVLYALLCDRELLEISQLPAWCQTIPESLLNRLSIADILPFLSNSPLPPIDQPLLDW